MVERPDYFNAEKKEGKKKMLTSSSGSFSTSICFKRSPISVLFACVCCGINDAIAFLELRIFHGIALGGSQVNFIHHNDYDTFF